MSIVPVSNSQGLSLAALGGVDQTPFDPETAAALGALLNLSLSSDAQLVATAQRTATEFESFISQLKEQVADLQARNQQLREQLAKKMREKRGVEQLHAEQVDPLKIKVAAAKEAVERMRHEVAASAAKVDQRVAAAIAEEAAGVQTITHQSDSEVGLINDRCNVQLASASTRFYREHDGLKRSCLSEFKKLDDLAQATIGKFWCAYHKNLSGPREVVGRFEHLVQGLR